MACSAVLRIRVRVESRAGVAAAYAIALDRGQASTQPTRPENPLCLVDVASILAPQGPINPAGFV